LFAKDGVLLSLIFWQTWDQGQKEQAWTDFRILMVTMNRGIVGGPHNKNSIKIIAILEKENGHLTERR
jgi:hypothetical protein